MIETKLFEVRDRGTFIPVMASRMTSTDTAEVYLLRRSGFSPKAPSPQILLTRFGDLRTKYTDVDWSDRTCRVAHKYIRNNWERLSTGDVIDIEFILGEAPAQKLSERSTE